MVSRRKSSARAARRRARQQEIAWEVIQLRGSPATRLGVVHALDEKGALKAALAQFDIAPALRDRLLIRRQA